MEEGDATEEIRPPSNPTEELSPPRPGLARSISRSFFSGGWADASAAASLGFLALLCVGAVFLSAAKLQFGELGSGANPISILTAIVLISLAVLGTTIELGGLELDVIPLGGLLVAGLAIAWAARAGVERGGPTTAARAALDGAKVGPLLAILCLVAALAFRFRTGPDPIAADPWSAFGFGLLWGSTFGTLGGMRAFEPLRATRDRILQFAASRSANLSEGLVAAAVMLLASGATAAVAGLVWAITSLLSGAPLPSFGPGDALAALIYIAGFGVNVIALVLSLALGASIEFGEQVTIGGSVVGNIRSIGLWAGNSPPWYAYLLVGIPIVSTLAGVLHLRRRAKGIDPPRALGVAVVGYSLVLTLLAWMSEARLGAGLVRDRGFGRMATDPLQVFALAMIWGAAVAAVGWWFVSRQRSTKGA